MLKVTKATPHLSPRPSQNPFSHLSGARNWALPFSEVRSLLIPRGPFSFMWWVLWGTYNLSFFMDSFHNIFKKKQAFPDLKRLHLTPLPLQALILFLNFLFLPDSLNLCKNSLCLCFFTKPLEMGHLTHRSRIKKERKLSRKTCTLFYVQVPQQYWLWLTTMTFQEVLFS